MQARQAGQHYERLASEYLQQHRMRIRQLNFSCKIGEIDIIAQERQAPHTLSFVEVRFRKNTFYGEPLITVTRAKQRRIIRAAQYYLQRNPWGNDIPCRFDVIGIHPDQSQNQIEWIKDAFQML